MRNLKRRFLWEAGASSGGAAWVALGGEMGRVVTGVSFPCEAAVEGLSGFTITTVFVLFRNSGKPHVIPRMPDIPSTTTNPGAWVQFALHKCQGFCLNGCSSHVQKGVEVVPLDKEETSSVWSLGAAISWGFCSSCQTGMNVTRRDATPIWQLVSWSRNQRCLCDFGLISANFSPDKVLLLPWATPRTASLTMFILFEFSYQY